MFDLEKGPAAATATPYTRFAVVGFGISGIGVGASLKRWYGIDDVCFFERHDTLGGTWHINKYPGCACDVPNSLYSYSFDPNPNWSRLLTGRDELWTYLDGVARKYDLVSKTSFGVTVTNADWIEEQGRWRLTIRDAKTGRIYHHESQFLFAATGQFIIPRELDVPGLDTFRGEVLHSARWPEGASVEGKKVVLFGNGATASQIVPTIAKQTKHLTQIIRAKHWILPSIDGAVPEWLQTFNRWVPGAMALMRLTVFVGAENELRAFYMTDRAAQFRKGRRAWTENYMREAAPEKYHEMLIPDFEYGCKRRIFDAGYLDALHADNVTLTNTKALEIVPEGVRTADGIIEADTLVLANGFVTNRFLDDFQVKGRGGVSVTEHWESFGGAEAYNCSVMSGFPNFFMLAGPNSVTGHNSVIIAAENSINYALRIIKPILDGKASVANVKPEAERRYVDDIQRALRNTVFFSGCSSWYVRSVPGGKVWNAMTYPWSQGHSWYRSLFPRWEDWEFSGAMTIKETRRTKIRHVVLTLLWIASFVYAKKFMQERLGVVSLLDLIPLIRGRAQALLKSSRR